MMETGRGGLPGTYGPFLVDNILPFAHMLSDSHCIAELSSAGYFASELDLEIRYDTPLFVSLPLFVGRGLLQELGLLPTN